MKHKLISIIAWLNLITIISVISSSLELFSRLQSFYLMIEYSGAIKSVDFSLFSLIVTTNKDAFKLINSPFIIAFSGLIINIAIVILFLVKSKINRGKSLGNNELSSKA